MKKALTSIIVLIFMVTAAFPVAESFGSFSKPDERIADYNMFNCPAFPNGYALPGMNDVLIKFFAMRTSIKFGKIDKLVFTLKTNKDLGKMRFRLYGGIPKNPLAAVTDLIPATAAVDSKWEDNTVLVFDNLDILVPPGYPQSFMLKAETGDAESGDWLSVKVDLCEADGACLNDGVSRKVEFLY